MGIVALIGLICKIQKYLKVCLTTVNNQMNFPFQAGGFAGKPSQPIISLDPVPDAIATLVFSRSLWSSQPVFPV